MRSWDEVGKGVGVAGGVGGLFRTASVVRWSRKLPRAGVRMVEAWLVALEALAARRDLNVECVSRLKREMVEDVNTQLELFGDGVDVPHAQHVACVEAWCTWYPAWVSGRIELLVADEPELFVSEAARRDAQSKRDKASRATGKRRDRDVATGKRLLAMLDDSGTGVIRWEPAKLSKRMAPEARGKRPQVEKMAEALVRLGVAEWQTTPSGKVWALGKRSEQL